MQIAEIKHRTQALIYEPRYAAMSRFIHPYSGFIDPPQLIEQDLRNEIERHERMIDVLRAGGEQGRMMINRWADDNARAMKEAMAPF